MDPSNLHHWETVPGYFLNHWLSEKALLGGSSHVPIVGLNHGSFRSLVPHGIRHSEISFGSAKKPHSILIKKALPHTALSEVPDEKKYWDRLFCQAESFMSLRYFQKVKLRSLMDFLNTSLHKTVMSSSVTQHWWRSRTSRFFKLAKWAAESLKPPPISLLHEMSNFLSSARCCKAVPETEKATSWSLAATRAQVRALAPIYFNVKLCPRYCRQSSWTKLQCIITADTQ